MSSKELSSAVTEAFKGFCFFKAHKLTLMDHESLCSGCLSYNTSMPNCGNVFTLECKHDFHSVTCSVGAIVTSAFISFSGCVEKEL